jgi:hypothetical protein
MSGPLVFQRPENINALVEAQVAKHGYRSLNRQKREWYKDMMARQRAARKGFVFPEYIDRTYMPTRRPVVLPTESSSPSPLPPVDPRRELNLRLKGALRRAGSAEKRQNRRTQRQIWQELANIGRQYQSEERRRMRSTRRFSERVRSKKAEIAANQARFEREEAEAAAEVEAMRAQLAAEAQAARNRMVATPRQPPPFAPTGPPVRMAAPLPVKKPLYPYGAPQAMGQAIGQVAAVQGTPALRIRMPPMKPEEGQEASYRGPPATWQDLSPLRGGGRTRKNKSRRRK